MFKAEAVASDILYHNSEPGPQAPPYTLLLYNQRLVEFEVVMY